MLWSYLGWRRFPREFSAFEVRRFLSLGPADREISRRRFRTRFQLGAAIQLAFVGMTGAMLDTLDHVPRGVLAHVGQQPSLPAPELTTLRTLYRRRKTLFDHQAWASSYAGLRWPEPDDVAARTESIASDSAATMDRHRIGRAAREALIARGCLIRGGPDVNDCVRRAV